MHEMLKEIMLNFHEKELDCGIPREINISTVIGIFRYSREFGAHS